MGFYAAVSDSAVAPRLVVELEDRIAAVSAELPKLGFGDIGSVSL